MRADAAVERVALLVPSGAGGLSSSLSLAPSRTSLEIHNPLERGSERHAFTYDAVEHNPEAEAPAFLGRLLGAMEACAESRDPRSLSCLIHGAATPSRARFLFRQTIDHVVRGAMALPGTRDEGDSVSFSILRIYSWATTDILKEAIVENNMVSPSRSPGGKPTSTIGRSDFTDNGGQSSALFRRLHHDTFEDRELPLLRRVLDRVLHVPDGHAAVKFTILWYCHASDTTTTITVGLLPSLARANRQFRDELLHLRFALETLAEEHNHNNHNGNVDGSASDWGVVAEGNRLAGLFLGAPSSRSVCVQLVTLVNASTPYSESNLHQCWYGAKTTGHPAPVWSPGTTPAATRTAVGGGVPADQSFDTSLSTPRRLFVEHWRQRPDSRSRSPSTENPLSKEVAQEADTPAATSAVFAPNMGSPSREQLEADGRVESADESNVSPFIQGATHVNEDLAAMKAENAQLRAEKMELLKDIKDLEAVKQQLEESIGSFFQAVGEEVLMEIDAAESEMLTEVERAQTILNISQASALSQEQQLLARFTALASEIRHSASPEDGRPRPTPPR